MKNEVPNLIGPTHPTTHRHKNTACQYIIHHSLFFTPNTQVFGHISTYNFTAQTSQQKHLQVHHLIQHHHGPLPLLCQAQNTNDTIHHLRATHSRHQVQCLWPKLLTLLKGLEDGRKADDIWHQTVKIQVSQELQR